MSNIHVIGILDEKKMNGKESTCEKLMILKSGKISQSVDWKKSANNK